MDAKKQFEHKYAVLTLYCSQAENTPFIVAIIRNVNSNEPATVALSKSEAKELLDWLNAQLQGEIER